MIGDLREKVDLLAPVDVADGGGGYSRQYIQILTLDAATRTTGGIADNTAEQRTIRTRRQFTVRAHAELTPEKRLRHRSVLYRITAIRDEDDRRRYLTVDAVEVAT